MIEWQIVVIYGFAIAYLSFLYWVIIRHILRPILEQREAPSVNYGCPICDFLAIRLRMSFANRHMRREWFRELSLHWQEHHAKKEAPR
jgi:hypothetical protein